MPAPEEAVGGARSSDPAGPDRGGSGRARAGRAGPGRAGGARADAGDEDGSDPDGTLDGGADDREGGVSGLVVVAVGLAVALLVAVGFAIVGWQRADQWERRAEDRAGVITELQERVTSSEMEIAALETRLDELASEKAGTEDEREAARLDAEQLEELVRQAGLVASDLDTCADGAVEVVNLVNSLGDYDLAQVNEYVAEVQRVCAQAAAENDALQQAIDDLDAATVDDEPVAPAPDAATTPGTVPGE